MGDLSERRVRPPGNNQEIMISSQLVVNCDHLRRAISHYLGGWKEWSRPVATTFIFLPLKVAKLDLSKFTLVSLKFALVFR